MSDTGTIAVPRRKGMTWARGATVAQERAAEEGATVGDYLGVRHVPMGDDTLACYIYEMTRCPVR